jgi:hypothetical protein
MEMSDEQIKEILNDTYLSPKRKMLRQELLNTGFFTPALADSVAKSDLKNLSEVENTFKRGEFIKPGQHANQSESDILATEVISLIESIISEEREK